MNYAMAVSSASLVHVMEMLVTSLEAKCVCWSPVSFANDPAKTTSQTEEIPVQLQDETK